MLDGQSVFPVQLVLQNGTGVGVGVGVGWLQLQFVALEHCGFLQKPE